MAGASEKRAKRRQNLLAENRQSDLRAEAASDVETLGAAQRLLGHTCQIMTTHYVWSRRGDTVKPEKSWFCRTGCFL
jgi:hypothetical protein